MDRLKIGEIIYNLRKQKGITQEKLAQSVGVSTAAVSKWESGNAYPDITLLAPLARLFEVSIDELMNFKEELSNEEIMKLYMEYAKIFEEKSLKEGIEICEEKLKEYPNNLFLKFRIGSLYMMYLSKCGGEEEIKVMVQKIIELLEISSESNELEVKEASYYLLSSLYSMNDETDKGIEVLKNIPKRQTDPEMMLGNIYLQQKEYEKAMKHVQGAMYFNLNNLIMGLGSLSIIYGKQDNINGELEILEVQRNLIRLFELNELFMHNNNLNFAYTYAKIKDKNNLIKYLDGVLDCINKLQITPLSLSNSKFFNTVELMEGAISLSFLKENMKNLLDTDPELEFIREDAEFKSLYNKVIDKES